MRDAVEKELLVDLISCDDCLPIEALCKRYGYSRRMIRALVLRLREAGAKIEYRRGRGYELLNKDEMSATLPFDARHNAVLQDDRALRRITELALLLTAEGYVSLAQMAERLYVSKTTVKSDLDELVRTLAAEDIEVERSRKGHRVALPLDERIHTLLLLLARSAVPVESVDTMFRLVLDGEVRYFELFHAVSDHVLACTVSINDALVAHFVNWLVLLARFDVREPRLASLHIPDEIRTDFRQLRTVLEPIVSMPRASWGELEAVYAAVLRGVPTPWVRTSAIVACREFSTICRQRYAVAFREDELRGLQEVMESWLLRDVTHVTFDDAMLDRIKTDYIGAFEMAMELEYVFESNGLRFREADIARFAMYLNELIVRRSIGQGDKVDVIVLNTCDPMVHWHVCNGIESTVDRRFFELRSMGLFQFNSIASTLDPQGTLVVDTGKSGVNTCVSCGLSYVVINPLLYRRDIEALGARVMEKRIERNRSRRLASIDRAAHVVSLRSCPSYAYSEVGARFACVLGKGMLVRQSANWDNHLDILLVPPFYRDGVRVELVIDFGFDAETELGRDLTVVRNMLVKRVAVSAVKGCRTGADVVELLRASVLHGTEDFG